MIAVTAVALPAHEPPKIASAEAENGDVAVSRVLCATVPSTASVPKI
jgi:hypothetical protein